MNDESGDDDADGGGNGGDDGGRGDDDDDDGFHDDDHAITADADSAKYASFLSWLEKHGARVCKHTLIPSTLMMKKTGVPTVGCT